MIEENSNPFLDKPMIDWRERTIERMVRKFSFALGGLEFSGFAVTGAETDEYVEWDNTGGSDFSFDKGSPLRTRLEEQLLEEIYLQT